MKSGDVNAGHCSCQIYHSYHSPLCSRPEALKVHLKVQFFPYVFRGAVLGVVNLRSVPLPTCVAMLATTGSCLCGVIKYSFAGEPVTRVREFVLPSPPVLTPQVLCHCLDCRKISGSHYADNALVAESSFSLSGIVPPLDVTKVLPRLSSTLLLSPQLTGIGVEPATYTISPKPSGPMHNITCHFCQKCGTTLYRTGELFPGYVSVRAGTIDDLQWMDRGVPKEEYYGVRKVTWLPKLFEKAQEV